MKKASSPQDSKKPLPRNHHCPRCPFYQFCLENQTAKCYTLDQRKKRGPQKADPAQTDFLNTQPHAQEL